MTLKTGKGEQENEIWCGTNKWFGTDGVLQGHKKLGCDPNKEVHRRDSLDLGQRSDGHRANLTRISNGKSHPIWGEQAALTERRAQA